MFITFEGGEGTGKSTLMRQLAKRLQPRAVVTTREPGGCDLAEQVREMVLGPQGNNLSANAELLMFLAARAQHIDEVIGPALARGELVMCDRFNDSTIAYQGYGRQLGPERVADLCRLTCDGIEPDLTFLLDTDPELGLMRATRTHGSDRIEEEALTFHQRVRQGFLQVAKDNPDRVFVIDTSCPYHEVEAQAWEHMSCACR